MKKRRRKPLDRGGEVAWTGVSSFASPKLYVFAVKADGRLVHDMWTRYVGRPSQNLGAPLDVRGSSLNHVFFVFLKSQRRQRRLRPGSEGRQDENLFAIVVPGWRPHPPNLVLFAPYVFASDTPGWRAEREIYGYPQQQGRVDIDLPDSFCVRARAIERFTPGVISEELEILCIKKKPGGGRGPIKNVPVSTLPEWLAQSLGATYVAPGGPGPVTSVPRPAGGVTAADASFFERSRSRSAEPPAPGLDSFDLIEALKGPLSMLFLKQFRDIVHSHRACYQAIVEASFSSEEMAAATPLENYELLLHHTDSVPIDRELGIRSGIEVPVDFAFRLNLAEMSFGAAKVISNPYQSPAIEVATPQMLSRLPRYVDRGGDAVWRQPSLLFGARIYGFGVEVPVERQDAVLKEFINDIAAASDSTYGSEGQKFTLKCPGLGMVMLLFIEYEQIMSGTDDDRRLGGTAYREFLVMQLALSEDRDFPELNWFIPFIYLDTDSPRLGGREIYGYPKQLGTIDPFSRFQGTKGPLDPPRHLELSTTVIHDKSQPNARRASVVRAKWTRKEPPTIKRRYVEAQDMLTDLLKDIGDEQGIGNALASASIGNVFLKQFRDCEDLESVCYQAVCKTDTMPGKFHGGGCLDPEGYVITIQNHPSEPLFGYIKGPGATGARATIEPVFAYWLDLDFELSTGRVIANPLEAPHVPNLSRRLTPPDTSPGPRRVRRSRQLELD